MERYYTRTTSGEMAVGNALSIRSGALRPGDMLDIHPGDHFGTRACSGHPVQAEVTEITVSSMRLRMKNRIFQCRPWRTGDAGVERLPGAVSNWTIEREDSTAPVTTN